MNDFMLLYNVLLWYSHWIYSVDNEAGQAGRRPASPIRVAIARLGGEAFWAAVEGSSVMPQL